MCVTINIDGKWCENIGELKALIGDVPFFPFAGSMPDEVCLCPVDLDALGTRFEQFFPDRDYDPMEKYFRTPPNPS